MLTFFWQRKCILLPAFYSFPLCIFCAFASAAFASASVGQHLFQSLACDPSFAFVGLGDRMGFQVFGSPVEGLFTNFYAAVMPKCIVNGMECVCPYVWLSVNKFWVCLSLMSTAHGPPLHSLRFGRPVRRISGKKLQIVMAVRTRIELHHTEPNTLLQIKTSYLIYTIPLPQNR